MGGGGGGGWWVVGLPEIKANSAQFQVKLPTGAELGNMHSTYLLCIPQLRSFIQSTAFDFALHDIVE